MPNKRDYDKYENVTLNSAFQFAMDAYWRVKDSQSLDPDVKQSIVDLSRAIRLLVDRMDALDVEDVEGVEDT